MIAAWSTAFMLFGAFAFGIAYAFSHDDWPPVSEQQIFGIPILVFPWVFFLAGLLLGIFEKLPGTRTLRKDK
jgi:phage terminase large subunit-like protein